MTEKQTARIMFWDISNEEFDKLGDKYPDGNYENSVEANEAPSWFQLQIKTLSITFYKED